LSGYVAGYRKVRERASRRLRVVFAKNSQAKYISHLDLVRAWERALRRAEVPLAYSQGFNPHPRLFFAAALPVGFTGREEMLDIILQGDMTPRELASRLEIQLPPGLELVSVREVPTAQPPLPAQVVGTEYRVVVESPDARRIVQSRLSELLAAETIVRQRRRRREMRVYDLRPLIRRLWVVGRRGDTCTIGMCLRADEQGTGRPDEVVSALGMEGMVRSIERVRLLFRGL
jgi:radical SAM-linked protein